MTDVSYNRNTYPKKLRDLGDGSYAEQVVVVRDPTSVTSRSGTITAGATAQSLAVANLARQGFLLQNLSAGDLYVNDIGGTASATQPSIKIGTGQLYEWPYATTAAMSIYGATTGQAFAAREW